LILQLGVYLIIQAQLYDDLVCLPVDLSGSWREMIQRFLDYFDFLTRGLRRRYLRVGGPPYVSIVRWLDLL
jgi:hypothetical protein